MEAIPVFIPITVPGKEMAFEHIYISRPELVNRNRKNNYLILFHCSLKALQLAPNSVLKRSSFSSLKL